VSGDIALLVHDGLDVLPINANIAFAAGELRARYYHRRHNPLSLADCFAAATALTHGAELATSDPPLATLIRAEGGKVLALPDSTGNRP
jgi:predicted nucleic acid-binding protein